MTPVTLISVFMTALFAALIMVPFLHRWAMDQRIVDAPDERKIHSNAVPRLGGIAICMSFLFSLLVFVDLTRGMRGILAGALMIFVTGLVDDLYGLSPSRKFFGELCAVLTAMVVGHIYIRSLGDLFGTGDIVLPMWLGFPFTLLAIVGVVNAFNLIDGLDGLAGGISVITLTAFGILGYHEGNSEVLALCVALLGGLLGFLKYNFYPARIFMGDAGSLVAGFVVGFLALGLTQGPSGTVQPVVPLLVIGLPVADTVKVMLRRILLRQSPFAADRTHVHHKFLDLGFEHRYTVTLIYGISIFCAAAAVFFHQAPAPLLLAGYLLLTLLAYGALRFFSTRRHLLRFLGNDSTQGIRESVLYRRLAGRVALTVPLLQVFVLVYLALAVVSGCAEGSTTFRLILIFLVACCGLLLLTRDSGNQYVLAMYYGAAMVITYVVARFGLGELAAGLAVRQAGDLLLLCMAIMAALRFLIRRPGEFFLASLDYLLLGLSLFLIVVAPQVVGIINLTGVLVRGIVFFVALKVVAEQGKGPVRPMAYAILGALVIIAVRGYLG